MFYQTEGLRPWKREQLRHPGYLRSDTFLSLLPESQIPASKAISAQAVKSASQKKKKSDSYLFCLQQFNIILPMPCSLSPTASDHLDE